jgi:hypothetical protein
MATVAAARTTDGHILESPAASRRARKATKEPDPMSTTAREQLSLATPQKVADLQWRPVDPNNPSGARMAALWGDPLSGPYGALLRMPAGFESPMHRHSSHERVVVINGASLHWAEGHDRRAARIMRSGDYLLIPAGVNHVSAATAGEECLELITQDGKFDFTLATPQSRLDITKIISFGGTRSLAQRLVAEDSAGSPDEFHRGVGGPDLSAFRARAGSGVTERMECPEMRLPNTAHTSRPWRIHEITHDFRLYDVWALPTPGGPDDFPQLVRQTAMGDTVDNPSWAARTLFAIRWKLGKLLGWDDPDSGVGSRVPTLRDRLPADLRDAPAGPEFDTLPFRSVYLTHDEWAAEMGNRTVHAVMHMSWVPDDVGGYRGQMAVLVKPNGLFGKLYMAGIAPFRHLIVYPPLMRDIAQTWRANQSHGTDPPGRAVHRSGPRPRGGQHPQDDAPRSGQDEHPPVAH